MLVSDFDFELPENLIAQEPAARGASRLLVVDRARGTWFESRVSELPALLTRGDLMVVNDSRVIPARLLGRRDPTGGAVEVLLLDRVDDSHWHALVHPGQKLAPGAKVVVEHQQRAGARLDIEILERKFFGRRLIRIDAGGGTDIDQAIDALGHVPLPPYIKRPDTPDDHERYQTVFARHRGSVAAPTAGLHFDEALVQALTAAGIDIARITLHVGYGTFKPVRAERVEEHIVDPEPFEISTRAATMINEAKAASRRVMAVGTTTTRALESAARNGRVSAGAGMADAFIYPGHAFQVVDGLLTNFHLPRSSLLMLVAAFAGRDLVLAAYRDAIARRFRFYSYGDAMLIV